MKKNLLTICLFASIAISAQKEFVSTSGGNWNVPATWDTVDGVANTSNELPTINDNVTVTSVTVTVPVGYAAECNNLTQNGSGNNRIVQVKETGSLTINGNFISNRSQDGFRLNYTGSAATKDLGSVIINGFTTSNGTAPSGRRAFINKRVPSTNWHLISVGGTNSRQNNLAVSTSIISINPTKQIYAIGAYNDANLSGEKYEYISSASTYANTVAFSKIGYAVKVDNASSNLNFRPVIVYDDASEDISDAGGGFNLVGNPHLSYLHANDAADPTNNLLRVNGANGANVLEEDTIWLWDSANNTFVTHNLGSSSLRIHPLQGFFVKAKSGGGATQSFSYTKAMRSHIKAGEFLKSTNNKFEIDLAISNGEESTNTSIKYVDNMTLDFDNGYDSSMFDGYSSELEIYTGLVRGNTAKKLAIQSLPSSDFENMVVPVGVTATANSEITFKANVVNLPKGHNVYLEDRLEGTITKLDGANEEYTVTLKESTTVGRFFLHTKTSAVLNIDSEILNSISMYKTNNTNLRVAGLKQGESTIALYNILGKKVMSSTFNTSGVQDISLPSLTSGVYIVQLTTASGKLNKKIVLK